MEQTMLGAGIYTLAEAGRYAGVAPRTARAWFKGWPQSGSGPLLRSDYAEVPGQDLVSFLDFTDLLVVASLRKVRASMHSIRRAYEALKPMLESVHPFSRSELYADDVGNLFIRAATEAGDETLVEVLKSQRAFPSILLPFLERIDYDPSTNLARRFEIAPGIYLDASRKYGKPITEANAMPTAILANAFSANSQDVDRVADWYGVEPDEVLRAVEYERGAA